MMQHARITTLLVGLTSVVWLASLALGQFYDVNAFGGFVPARVSGEMTIIGALPVWATPLSATFLHADIFHLGFNMLMLFWCGKQIEPALGARLYLLLYGIGAYAAALGQWALSPHDGSVMIGASGAISAVVAVYALVFSEQKVQPIGPIPAYVVRVAWLAAAWVGVQALIGFGFGFGGGLIAVGAHIGGFIAGLLLARPMLRMRYRNRD